MGRPRWIGTVLYVPVLYGLGWLLARPLGWWLPALRADQVNLVGAFLALALLLMSLPARLRRAWCCNAPWRRLGLRAEPRQALEAWLRGLLKAAVLLALVVIGLLLAGAARWQGAVSSGVALNALALMIGVGFAEELLFRGWLLGELELRLGARQALSTQALVFALVHPWARAGWPGALGLLGGLALLGLGLGLQKRADGGLLWGAVGLHGGLVGGWFALQAGPLQLVSGAPAWLTGPGTASPNPIGGVLGWLGLGALLWVRRGFWGIRKPLA